METFLNRVMASPTKRLILAGVLMMAVTAMQIWTFWEILW